MTFLYIDVETTGLDPKTSSIIQLSGILSVDGVETEFNYKMKPYKGETIPEEITKITGITNEDALNFARQEDVFKEFKSLLDMHIGERKTRAYLVGYNVRFDDEFLRDWFTFNGAPFGWGYYVWFPYIDVMDIAAFKAIGFRQKFRNFKLVTVYEYFTGKPLEGAHDALIDIRATKELFEILAKDLLFKK